MRLSTSTADSSKEGKSKSEPATPAGRKSSFAGAQYGQQVAASETSAKQQLYMMGAGRYQYINDFWKSLEKGPVRLRDGAAHLSAKDIEQNEAQERAVKLMQRAMLLGTLLVFGSGAIGWWITKKVLGVANIAEFGEKMKEKFPKVTGEAKETVLGRHLQELSEHSRDSISESEKLAEWRRSLRSSFNTEEGAKLARENSILLAELRKEERIARKSSKEHKEHRGPAGETQVVQATPPSSGAATEAEASAAPSV